jgi:hypothetical protein
MASVAACRATERPSADVPIGGERPLSRPSCESDHHEEDAALTDDTGARAPLGLGRGGHPRRRLAPCAVEQPTDAEERPPEHGGLHMHREKQEVAGVGGRPFSPVREARDALSDRGGREDRVADQQWPAGAVSPGAAYARGRDQGTPDDRQERGDADDDGSAGPDPRGRTARPRTFELIAAASDMPARSDRRVGVTGGAVRGSRQRPRLLSLAVASALASAWALRRRSRSSQVPEMSSSQPVTTFKPSARSS